MATPQSNNVVNSGQELPDASSPKFFDNNTTKDFSLATGYLTALINVMLYLYMTITNKWMPNNILVLIVLVLSIFYVVVFFKRTKPVSMQQKAFGITINSALLFTSLTGTNNMLDKARQGIVDNTNAVSKSSSKQASVGDFFLHIVFPTNAIFSDKQEAVQILNEAQTSIDSANSIITNIIATNATENATHTKTVDSLKSQIAVMATINKNSLQTINQSKELIAQIGTQPGKASAAPAIASSPSFTRTKESLEKQSNILQQQVQQQKQEETKQPPSPPGHLQLLQQQQQLLQRQQTQLQLRQQQWQRRF